MDKEKVFETLKQNREELESRGVEKIGLFGSYVKGEENDSSDLDFLVVFKENEKTYRNFMRLKRYLENLFNQEIDLATKNSLKPSIKEKVIGEVEYAETA